MKKVVRNIALFLIFLLSGGVLSQAQNPITLTFTGRNQNNDNVKLGSVFVENITQRWQEVLYYPDTTLYFGTVGLPDPVSDALDLRLHQNVPNPFEGITEFSLQIPESSELVLEICDLGGKVTASYKGKLEQGNHRFRAWLSTPQTYLLSAKTDDGVARVKMVNAGHGGQNVIEYLGMGSALVVEQENSPKGGTLLPLAPGDWMKYQGYAQIADTYFESPQITQQQYNSEEIVFLFDVPLPEVTTLPASIITSTTAYLYGNLSNESGHPTLHVGFDIADNEQMNNATRYNVNSANGNFQFVVSGLQPYTNYYFRAFASTELGTTYGGVQHFITLMELPVVLTSDVTDITGEIATGGGTVTYEGGGMVTARGVCWNTAQNPTIVNSHTTNGTGLGTFTSTISGLSPGTTYNVRAYATNSAGTAYGEQKSFTTPIIVPTVTTSVVTSVTSNSAMCGGFVTADGGDNVTARGVCWSTSANPTVNDSHTTNGTGMGNFISNITGLTPNTTYYVRAYATNSVGTAYGAEATFTTDDL